MSDNDFRIGQYVRMVGQDRGTGKIEMVRQETTLTSKGQVIETVYYGVTWLDTKGSETGKPIHELLPGGVLMPSARSVPTMTSPAEAEAWMEQQMQTGNWTDKVVDMAESAQESAVATACMDCVYIDGKITCTRPGLCNPKGPEA